MASSLLNAASSISSPVEKRLFAEYGAVFATTAIPPPVIIFADAAQVEWFQSTLSISSAFFGEHEIALQADALDALAAAASEMAVRGGSITARAADAGGRSYEDTIMLWTRNVARGLEHWHRLGRVTRALAESLCELTPAEQVAAILNLEETEQLFFGTLFDKSILYSVAAPGASQHLSMLAFDVAEYMDREVERSLRRHGWYRTVPNDLPHFTYLGHNEAALPDLGLQRIERIHSDRVYDFWTPDLDRL
ncbi:MAG: hypothetical protein AABN33_17665 [Acidobacteriota bacterium]